MAPGREVAFYILLVAALLAFVGSLRLAAKEYRRTHKRLFGQ